MSLTLFELRARDGQRYSQFSWRSTMALAHKGLRAEHKAVRVSDKAAIAFSSQDKVPILVDGKDVIPDSWRIAEHLESRYPDAPSLFGGETGRGLARLINAWVDRTLIGRLVPLLAADVVPTLDETDGLYLRTQFERFFGQPLEELAAAPSRHRGFSQAARSGTRRDARAAFPVRRQSGLCGLYPVQPVPVGASSARSSASNPKTRSPHGVSGCSICSAALRARRLHFRRRRGSAVDATLTDWLDRWARETPDHPAVLTPAPITYAQLQQKVRALAAGFTALGIAKGDTVAAQLPNGAEFLLCYLAAGSIGATLQTIHMPYRGAEIETLLAHSKAVAVVCVSRAKDSPAELILSLKAKLPHLKHVMAVGDEPPSGALPFASLVATAPDVTHTRPTADDRFLLLYTSGTTAAPKGVPISYRKFLTNARLSASELKIDARSILLSAAPFTHLYGLFSVNLALSVGATIAILPAFTPPALAATMDACRPTGLFVAPAHMAACLNEGLLTAERFASLHFALISGSVCAPSLALAVEERMTAGRALQLWGMSEMQAGTYTRPDDPIAVRSRTAGRASPGTQLRIADDMTPLGWRGGKLQVRGVGVRGLSRQSDATAAAFTADGWFRTGDLGRLDKDGNLELTGRLRT